MMTNPIKDNRIVVDKTFATRLYSFISNVEVYDQISEEEQEYLLNIADKLIAYQKQTMSNEDEIAYFKNLEK